MTRPTHQADTAEGEDPRLPVLQNCSTIQLAGGRNALVDAGDYGWLSAHRWRHQVDRRRSKDRGYATRIRNLTGGRWTEVKMHREVNGTPAGWLTDHINGDSLDNRRENLRNATNGLDMAARKVPREGRSSRYRGVSQTESGRWQARIGAGIFGGRSLHVGTYDSELEAAVAYNVAAIAHYGPFARLNECSVQTAAKPAKQTALEASIGRLDLRGIRVTGRRGQRRPR